MRASYHDVQDLTRLAGLSGDELRVAFRSGLAHLAAQAALRPLPLEGLDPTALERSVARALEEGLFSDLTWLSSSSAAMALYELMSALPEGESKAQLNQAVVSWLAEADATTFTALATALAQSTRGGFANARMRSRVSLALMLPLSRHARVDDLALSLISQPDYAREWVEWPSQASLPSRRLAARVLECAARAAAHRFAQRDDSGLRALGVPGVKAAWDRLLADRESLVWRHVAVARGLLAATSPDVMRELERALDAELTPTEWRRGAASIAAAIAVMPTDAVRMAQQMLGSAIIQKDPGVPAAMLYGIARAAEAQPEIAQRLVIPLLKLGGAQAVEAFLEMLDEGPGVELFEEGLSRAAAILEEQLASPSVHADDGAYAVMAWMLERCRYPEGHESAPDRAVRAALLAFADEGAVAALQQGKLALDAASQAFSGLAALDLDSREGRVHMVCRLSELDAGLCASSTLTDLIALGADEGASLEQLNSLYDELTALLLTAEQAPNEEVQVAHATLRMRRVRTLLHLVDADGSYGDEVDWVEVRQPRRLRTARTLLARARREAHSPLRRAVLACLARSFDALVREEIFELSDVILCASLYVPEPKDVATLAEASMVAELEAHLFALSELSRKALSTADNVTVRREGIEALGTLVDALPAAHSPRVSMLRWALLRLKLGLSALYAARSQSEIASPDGGNALEELAEALQALAQLVAGTRRRLSPNAQVALPQLGIRVRQLGTAFEQAVSTRSPEHLVAPIAALEQCLNADLSPPFALPIARVIGALKTLPIDPPGARSGGKLRRVTSPGIEERSMPPWMPTNRLLGGFYVLHPLGEGGVGSVFVVRRADERDDERAEVFALKVPEYNGAVSNVLSEAEFMKMFREEAGALLALPDDVENLARFVTFDAGIKPKPILVMEHVEGPSLERLLSRRHMDVAQAFEILLGIAKGLAAMHKTGIAHLDLKPSNVILRNFWSGGLVPVLVDFGLAGRRLRPGCGTANYAAPEIWGADVEADGDPRPADVYAFGCLAYELLTGDVLFGADTDFAIVSAHISHDGAPAQVQAMHTDLALRALADLLMSCLRQKPSARVTIHEVIRQLPFLAREIESRAWPLLASLGALSRPLRHSRP